MGRLPELSFWLAQKLLLATSKHPRECKNCYREIPTTSSRLQKLFTYLKQTTARSAKSVNYAVVNSLRSAKAINISNVNSPRMRSEAMRLLKPSSALLRKMRPGGPHQHRTRVRQAVRRRQAAGAAPDGKVGGGWQGEASEGLCAAPTKPR
jgi:hypothetical protein